MNYENLVDGNIPKNFFRYVILSLICMLGLSSYVLADTFFIANGVGQNGLTALNIVLPIFNFINALSFMLGMGGSTLFSFSLGAKENKKCSTIFSKVILLTVLIGGILTILGLFFSTPIARLLGATDEIISLSSTYLKIILLFSSALILNNVLVCFIRNDGEPKLASLSMLSASLFNIFFDWLLVCVFKMGISGAALATGISPLIGLCVLLPYIIKNPTGNLHFTIKLKEHVNTIEILKLGIPYLVGDIATGAVVIIFNLTLLKLAGNVGIAAYGIIANIAYMCNSTFAGIAQGIQPLISINYGAKNSKRINSILCYALLLSVILGIFFFLTGLFFNNEIALAFSKEHNMELLSIATRGIKLYFSAFICMGLNLSFTSYFSSIAKPKTSFIISSLRNYAFSIPLVLFLPNFIDLDGVWISVPLAETFTILISIILFVKIKPDVTSVESLDLDMVV